MSSVTVNASAILSQTMHNGHGKQSSFSSSPPSSFMTGFPLDPRIASGSVGSLVSAVVTTPFEVAKIKLQYHQPNGAVPAMTNSLCYRSGVATTATSALPTTHGSQPTGTFSMLRHVIAKEGVRGIYAGLAPTMIMSIPNYLLYLISYDEIVQVLKTTTAKQDENRNHNTAASSSLFFLSETSIPLAGGALARLIATMTTAPLELLRTRHALPQIPNKNNNASVWTELTTMVRNEGFPALYRGVTPQLVRDVPFAALYMLFLERFRSYTKPVLLTQHQQQCGTASASSSSFFVGEFVNAGLAGMMAATLTAPADVIKSRIQFSYSSSAIHTNNKSSMMDIASSIVQKEGIAGLWRGNQARMLKVAPQYAIMISCYEVGKKMMSPTE